MVNHEGSIRQPIPPWANALTMELNLTLVLNRAINVNNSSYSGVRDIFMILKHQQLINGAWLNTHQMGIFSTWLYVLLLQLVSLGIVQCINCIGGLPICQRTEDKYNHRSWLTFNVVVWQYRNIFKKVVYYLSDYFMARNFIVLIFIPYKISDQTK